jgi:cobalt-zinc-cadmium efflux system outer membrane protein
VNTFLKLILLLTVVLCITTGCTVFHSRPISPTQTASALESRSLENPELKAFLEKNLHIDLKEWPPRLWNFEMLTFAAFYYHPDLDVARAKWGVAEAGIITAGAIPNPTLGSSIGLISNQTSGVNPWLYGLSLDIPIETAGKRGYRLSRAKYLSTAARLNVVVIAWKVRSRLRANLVNLYAAGNSETLLKKEETIQEEIVRLMEKRLTVGEVSLPDVTQAHISLNQVRLSLRDAQRQRAEALAQVAASLGVSVAAVEGINLSFDFIEKRPANLLSSDIRRQALLTRADILSALSEYDAAQSALQLEISRQYPDIRLGPGYNFDDAQNKWTIGLAVTLPVFNRNEGPIAEDRARRAEAAARFTALQAGIMGEIDRALSGYRSVLRTLETAEALLLNQRSRVQSARAMFDAGETDRLTFLTAQMELAASELARLDIFVKVQQSLGLLEDAMQRPLDHTAFSLPEMKPLTEER